MSTYLIVSNHTAESDELTSALRRTHATDPDAEFVLLVPALPVNRLAPLHESSLRDVSRDVATRAASSLRDAGFTIRWTVVTDATPLVALETEVRDHPNEYAGLVVATLPEQHSRWHDFYLFQRAASWGLPLDHVVDDTGCAVG